MSTHISQIILLQSFDDNNARTPHRNTNPMLLPQNCPVYQSLSFYIKFYWLNNNSIINQMGKKPNFNRDIYNTVKVMMMPLYQYYQELRENKLINESQKIICAICDYFCKSKNMKSFTKRKGIQIFHSGSKNELVNLLQINNDLKQLSNDQFNKVVDEARCQLKNQLKEKLIECRPYFSNEAKYKNSKGKVLFDPDIQAIINNCFIKGESKRQPRRIQNIDSVNQQAKIVEKIIDSQINTPNSEHQATLHYCFQDNYEEDSFLNLNLFYFPVNDPDFLCMESQINSKRMNSDESIQVAYYSSLIQCERDISLSIGFYEIQ